MKNRGAWTSLAGFFFSWLHIKYLWSEAMLRIVDVYVYAHTLLTLMTAEYSVLKGDNSASCD